MSAFSFNALVTGLSNEERLDMLKKIEECMGADLSVPDVAEYTANDMFGGDLERKYQSESVFVRFYLWLRTLFSTSNRSEFYNSYLIGKRVSSLEVSFPGLMDYRRKIFLDEFYVRMKSLWDTATFFLPYVSLYENKHGDFYVFLSTIVLPNLFDSLQDEHLSPELVKDNEAKVAFLHHFDEILQSIPSTERNIIYSYVQTADWLRQFVHLPFHRVCGRFFTVEGEHNICQMESIADELPDFAKILCNVPKIQGGFLEALALFANKDRIKTEEPTEGEEKSGGIKGNNEIYRQINKMIDELRYIKNFNKTIPIPDICSVMFEDYYWAPRKMDGVENWFVTFKSQWKSFFEGVWDSMTIGQKREKAFAKESSFFTMASPPMLENRPWEAAWCDASFKYEFSLGFLPEFFKQFGEFLGVNLKILLTEGEFIMKKNRVEFTDAINIFNHLEVSMSTVSYDLLPQGDIGNIFLKAEETDNHTLQERNNLANTMAKFAITAESLIDDFLRMSETLIAVLGGIIANTGNGYYESIYNLTTIQGTGNMQFRENLSKIKKILTEGEEILMDIYDLEKNAEEN